MLTKFTLCRYDLYSSKIAVRKSLRTLFIESTLEHFLSSLSTARPFGGVHYSATPVYLWGVWRATGVYSKSERRTPPRQAKAWPSPPRGRANGWATASKIRGVRCAGGLCSGIQGGVRLVRYADSRPPRQQAGPLPLSGGVR